jgi:hypothetical protein
VFHKYNRLKVLKYIFGVLDHPLEYNYGYNEGGYNYVVSQTKIKFYKKLYFKEEGYH